MLKKNRLNTDRARPLDHCYIACVSVSVLTVGNHHHRHIKLNEWIGFNSLVAILYLFTLNLL